MLIGGGKLRASDSGSLNIWGRVKDQLGRCVKGAPVVLMASAQGKERCLGYTYSSLQGVYCFRIDSIDQEIIHGGLRVLAGVGDCAAAGEESAAPRYRCNLFAVNGDKTVECQVINYCCLKIIVRDDEGPVVVDTVPETVKVSCCRDSITGSRTFGITGRGYITAPSDSGEGEFSMVVCVLGEGSREQELVKVVIVPEDRDKKRLFFDSGGTIMKLL